jgi:drug/metabolite transporter (DMT)-like permease
MVAFASNSILCRLALVDKLNDPISFTLIRLISGAAILLVFFLKYKSSEGFGFDKKTILAPLMLFSYALFFSLSYVQISSGVGALILFTSVQITMIVTALFRGQSLNRNEIVGFSLAAFGFVYLLFPGLHMPPFVASILMVTAGVSWGIYSLLGQGQGNPVYSTARNFVMTLPVAVLLLIYFSIKLSPHGFALAMISGALTSGLGYVIWYKVLRELQTSTAAIVQLSVPPLAAFGGLIFLGELPTLRLFLASLLIIAGIFIKVQKPKLI